MSWVLLVPRHRTGNTRRSRSWRCTGATRMVSVRKLNKILHALEDGVVVEYFGVDLLGDPRYIVMTGTCHLWRGSNRLRLVRVDS